MDIINSERYYHSSGRIGAAYMPLAILAIALIAIFSFLYALAMFYIPYLYLRIIITFCMGVLIGLSVTGAVNWGKLRNKLISIVTLGALFVVFIYVHFTAYAATVYYEFIGAGDFNVAEVFALFLSVPGDVFSFFVELVIPIGVWGFGENPNSLVNGWFLLAIWITEHAIIAGTAYFVMHNQTFKKPFFERSGKWGVEKVSSFKWEYQLPSSFDALRVALESVNIEYFRTLSPAAPASAQTCRFSCFEDPSGESSNVYLSLYNSIVTFENNGKMSEKKENIVQNIIIPKSAYAQLEQIAAAASPPQQ